MNQVPPPNLVAELAFSAGGGSDPASSPLQEKRQARDVKERELGAQLASEGSLLKTLKTQVSQREDEISDLHQKYKQQSAAVLELEEKLSQQNKANAETNMRYFE